jgi:hypothetical protein
MSYSFAGPSPEDEGIPEVADDTSTAYDRGDRPQFNEPTVAMPADNPWELPEEEIGPEEEADLTELGDEEAAEDDADYFAEEQSGLIPDDGADDPELAEFDPDAVSTFADARYEEPDLARRAGELSYYDTPVRGARIGRLTDPGDDGAEDFEAESFAEDTDEIEGLSAEESAMHLVDEEDEDEY